MTPARSHPSCGRQNYQYYNKQWSRSKFLTHAADPTWAAMPPGGIINELGADGLVYHRPVRASAVRPDNMSASRYAAMTMGRHKALAQR